MVSSPSRCYHAAADRSIVKRGAFSPRRGTCRQTSLCGQCYSHINYIEALPPVRQTSIVGIGTSLLPQGTACHR